jgi:hypothetical protein
MPMGLKAWVVFALPTLAVCRHWFESDINTFQSWHAAQAATAQFLISYFFVGAALFAIGTFELFRRRHKEAFWDFVFVAFALTCVLLLEALQNATLG